MPEPIVVPTTTQNAATGPSTRGSVTERLGFESRPLIKPAPYVDIQ